jgi:hypothetical protein
MKGILIVATLLSLVAFAPVAAHAQKSRDTTWEKNRKYDFAIQTEDGKTSSWGNWNSGDIQQYKSNGPGIYVRKDGAMYYIADRATLRQAEAANKPMQETGERMRAAGKDAGRKAKEDSKWAEKQKEIGRHMGEAGKAFGEENRGHAPSRESSEKFQKRMKELGEQMKELSAHQYGPGSEFQKTMHSLGEEMQTRAREANDRITKLIDDAFAKGLAKKL